MSKKVKVNWYVSEQNVTVNYDGQTHIVSRADGLADQLIKAIKEKKYDQVPNLVNAATRIETFSKGTFVVKDGEILVNGIPAPAALGKKILKFSSEGLPHEPLVKFAEKLLLNPSFRAVNELFQFLEKNDHPLTEDGNFIAYKRVRSDFTDIHSGTFDNSVGKLVEMPRNQVNEDSAQTCSAGLHVANWDYAHNKFASHNPDTDVMVEVEVNPADVVAVPNDYNQSKMRVCAYKVLAVIDEERSDSLRYVKTPAVQDQDVDDRADDDDDLEDEEEEESSSSSSEEEEEDESEDELPADTSLVPPLTDVNYDDYEDLKNDNYPWEDEIS